MRSSEIIAKLEAAGWEHRRTKGSHYIMGKVGKYPVVVPHPTKDVYIEIIKRIEKQSGVKLRE
ncbi:MAG TPA: type II toxin-antitoxin system HicA family toxin [Gemmatimonadales bacterium]|jgi:predicted RNA binding protein YcfA (HicA-like mRNA interferase family)|nr:type II toxin-antitoxin system HicA family toxin [Gemmatimonadales bacterium]